MKREELISNFVDSMDAMRRVLFSKHAKHTARGIITRAQFGVLMLASEEGISIKELARRFSMSSSAATQLVDGLVKDALLVRTEDSHDRRKLKIFLTSRGKKKLAQARNAHLETLTTFFRPLSTNELITLLKIQEKILKNLT